jgi:hypothetical protein
VKPAIAASAARNLVKIAADLTTLPVVPGIVNSPSLVRVLLDMLRSGGRLCMVTAASAGRVLARRADPE